MIIETPRPNSSTLKILLDGEKQVYSMSISDLMILNDLTKVQSFNNMFGDKAIVEEPKKEVIVYKRERSRSRSSQRHSHSRRHSHGRSSRRSDSHDHHHHHHHDSSHRRSHHS